MRTKPVYLQSYNISPRKEYPPHILRIAKNARQKSKINSKAKGQQNQSQNVQPPHLKLKRKPGAPKGNRNALKTGLHTGEMRALKVKVRRVIAEAKFAAALVQAEAARMDAETAVRLRAAEPAPARIAPPRAPMALHQIACASSRSRPLLPSLLHRGSPESPTSSPTA